MSETQEAINYNLLKHRFRGYLPVVIDVETAGLNAKTDALLELAAITLKMDDAGNLIPDQKCHFHIQPFEGANIDPESIKFNGIDIDNPLRGAVSENIAISEMFKMVRKAQKDADCQRSIIVAHNAAWICDGCGTTHECQTQPFPSVFDVLHRHIKRFYVRTNGIS